MKNMHAWVYVGDNNVCVSGLGVLWCSAPAAVLMRYPGLRLGCLVFACVFFPCLVYVFVLCFKVAWG